MRGLHSDLVEGGEGGREDSVLQQAEVSEGEGGELPEQAGAGLAPVSVEQVLPGFSPLHSLSLAASVRTLCSHWP